VSRQVLATIGLAAWVVAPAPAAAQDPADVEVEIVPVAGRVSMLRGGDFGNIGVSAGPDGILIVDDQIAPLGPKILAALDLLGDHELAFVLNTHWHGDHTHGNLVFGPEAPIVAHVNTRKRLMTRQEAFGMVFEPLPPEALPVVTFADSLSIHFNGEEIRVVHLPSGHTDGDIVVWFTGSNVVHMGDLFQVDRFPAVDLATGGDVEGFARNVAAVLELLPPGARIIPGHGPLSGVEDLQRFHSMLLQTMGIVRSRIEAGNTLEEIQAAGLPEPWKSWGEGFISTERWIETIWRSLTGHDEGAILHPHGHRAAASP
jgi:cyclase